MGTGSSAEQRSPQETATAAGGSQPSSSAAETPTAALGELEQLEDPAKLLQKNGQISSINGIAEEQVEFNLKPEELNGQQQEVVVTDVGQRETPNVIVKEESAEHLETKTPESDKTNVDDKPKASPDADKQLLTPEEQGEEQELPSESPSNDVGFKKVFKFVGFKFTVRKDKTEKSEPVQLLNVKADDTEVAAGGAGDCKEVKTKMVHEEIQSEESHSVEKTEQQTQTEQVKEDASSEPIKGSPVEPTEGCKEAEIKSDSSKLVESPTSPLANETASPLRKFFTQGWAGFRKKTSFRKPKDDVSQPVEREKQGKEEEMAEENAIKEELEKEKAEAEKDEVEISVEHTDEIVKREREEIEEVNMRNLSTEKHQEPLTFPSQVSVKIVNKESEICLTEKIGLALKEKAEPMQECLSPTEQSTPALPEKKQAAPLAKEMLEEKLDKCAPVSPFAVEKTEEHFEILEDKPEPKAPLATESFDEIPTEFNNDLTTIVKKEQMKTNKKELIHEQFVETDAELQRELTDEELKPTEMQECLSPTEQSALALAEKKQAVSLTKEMLEEKLDKCAAEEVKTKKKELIHKQFVETDAELQRELTDEELKITEIILVAMNEQIKKTELSSGAVETCIPPEGITNEVELLSSQERAKIQGSPLKKLFTSSSLKKLSGKKNKVKREEAKSGEQTQQLSDSAESPDEQKGLSSASSPEETTELSSVEKVIDVVQVTETEESSTSDMEKKREGVTPWASFKKMVTPKKRVRRLSESDKEEELEKAKNITLSSTESAPCEEQEDDKENGQEQKLEKSTDEPKRRVDTSVSWEALICVGSSKKRARKSSSSDEEVGQRLAQEGQKPDESGTHKEITQDMTFTSSQESGEGNSSPEQVGSPSESEGVSTWQSFKRLVTPRRKSKTRMEDRAEEPVTVASSEHSASDGDSGKEESWVSFKKLMPGRRKKKSDGIPEHAPVEEVGEEITEDNEEDYDVPAVVPLSEYEAAEQEKFEAQKAKEDEVTKKKTLDERTEESKDTVVDEQSNEVLVHAVTVTVVEGERAVTSIEERSPSWISATVTEPIECADEDEVKQIEQTSETAMEEEIAEVTKHMPEIRKDISGDTIISELELTPEAITAREEASGVEEVTEVSCAEETTEMVSAVSRLSESPDTTEVATPVQEVEGQQNLEELNKQTQEVLKEAAERVRLSDGAQLRSEKVSEIAIQSMTEEKSKQEITVMFPEVKLADSPLKVEDSERVSIQTNEGTESDHSEGEVIGSGLKEVLEKSKDSCAEEKERPKESINLDRTDESETEQRHEEISKEQTTEEKSEEEDFGFVIVTAGEEPEVKVDETIRKQQDMSLEAVVEKKYGTIDAVVEVTAKLEEKAEGEVTEDGVTEVDEWMKRIDEEKTEVSQNLMLIVVPGLESENAETSTTEVKEALIQSDVKDTEQFIQSADNGELMPEVPNQSQATDVPVGIVVNEMNTLDFKDVTIGLEIKSTEKVATGTYLQNKDTEAFLHNVEPKTLVPKMEPDIHLQKVEMEIPVENVKRKPHLVNTETQIHVDTIETGISIRKRGVEVHQLNSETNALTQKVETESHKEVEKEPCLLNVEAEVLAKTSDVMVGMKFSPDTTKAEIPTDKATVLAEETEVEVPVEKTGGKVHVESSSEKSDVEVRAPAEKIDVKVDVVSSVAKVVEETSAENEVVEFHAEEVVAEVAKVVEMKVPAEKMNMKNFTEDAKLELPQKTIEVLTEKAKVDIPSERVNTRTFTENINMEAPVKQLEELVQGEAVYKPSDQEENLQNFKAVVSFQSEMEDTVNSVEVPVCADLQQAPVVNEICTVPVHRVTQNVTSSFQVEYLDFVGSEGPSEVKDPVLSPKTNELGDVTLVLESKCAEDIGTETPVQKRKNIPFMETEGKSKSMDTAASEVLMQSEKENVLALKSNFVEAELTEHVVINVATFVENELGNTELAIKSKHIEAAATEAAAKTEVEEDTLFSNSRFAERIPESCQKGQVLLEKVVTVENDKLAENTELTASEHVLYAAPMQQHPKQQEVITTDIPEMQSHEAYKSSVSVTAAAVEEQVIEESVIVTETSTETIQSFLEEPKETAFKIVQPVTVAHSDLGAKGPYTEAMLWAEKTESATEKPVLPVDDLIQTHVFDLISKMKSELSQETKKQIQSPERSPSLTHVKIQKDDVQPPGTIESQSTNIVLKIIQNPVDKLEKTDETVSVSSQVCENKSEIQESLQADQPLLSVKVEEIEFLVTEKKVSLSRDTFEDGESWDTRKADAYLEAVKHMLLSDEHLGAVAKPVQDHGTVNEAGQDITEEPGLQKENSETKVGSEVDSAIPTETERVVVDGFVSGELPKESLDIDQPKLKSIEVGQSVQMQEHFIEQQTYTKRKEDQSTGLGESHMDEDVNNQDYTSCDSLQLKSELTEC